MLGSVFIFKHPPQTVEIWTRLGQTGELCSSSSSSSTFPSSVIQKNCPGRNENSVTRKNWQAVTGRLPSHKETTRRVSGWGVVELGGFISPSKQKQTSTWDLRLNSPSGCCSKQIQLHNVFSFIYNDSINPLHPSPWSSTQVQNTQQAFPTFFQQSAYLCVPKACKVLEGSSVMSGFGGAGRSLTLTAVPGMVEAEEYKGRNI